MDVSTAKEFGEERTREVAALVEEIKQHIAFVDRWCLAREDAPSFFADAARTGVENIFHVYGQLVALNESWARKTTQLTEPEEACKQKGRELEAAYKQEEKELDEAYKRKADRLKTRIAEKEGELSSQIERIGRQFSILETATVEQVAKKAEVEKQLFEKNEKIEELARAVKDKDDAASTQFSGLEAIIADQAAKAAKVEKRFVEKSKKVEELEKEAEEKAETIRTQLSILETATTELTQKKTEMEKQFSKKDAKIQDLEKEAKEWAETFRTQLSILGTVTAELAQKKAEMEKQFSEKNAKIQELEKSKAEVESKLAEKDAKISELQALKDHQEGEAHALRASIDDHRVEIEKELRTEFEEEKDQWRNCREDGFAGSRDRELLRLETVAEEMQGLIAPAKVMMANGEKVDEGLKSLRTAIGDYQTFTQHIEARADRLEEERVEGAAQVQEEFGEISKQSALLARRVEEFNQHVRAMNQRTLEPDRREREIYELGARAGLGEKRSREYSADEARVLKRRRSRGPSQSSFGSLGSVAGGLVEGVENVHNHGVDMDEEGAEERAEREAEEITLVARQVNDREPSAAEEGDSVAGEDQELGELRKRIDASFAEMCGSVGFPEKWSLRRRVSFFDRLFEKEEEIHQKAAGSKKKAKKPSGEFEPTTTSWAELFDKGVKGTPQTHGGGSRICFMALNGRLRAKFPVQVVDGSEVPENRRVLCATHKDGTPGDGRECVFVECVSGKNVESDWRGGVKWMVREHPR